METICLTALGLENFKAEVELSGHCRGVAGLERKNSSDNDDVRYSIKTQKPAECLRFLFYSADRSPRSRLSYVLHDLE